MIGWHITIYQQAKGGALPAAFGEPTGAKLAMWQTGAWGLEWIKELVAQNLVNDLGGNGYPFEFTAKIEQLRPAILAGAPRTDEPGVIELKDIPPGTWLRKTAIDRQALLACEPGDWVLIRVWDQS